MARSSAEVADRINLLRRVWWGTVRVHPEYRRDVANFLRQQRQHAQLQDRRGGIRARGGAVAAPIAAAEIPIPTEPGDEVSTVEVVG